jgi:cbb3-type cytochrome oxidase maturation protein
VEQSLVTLMVLSLFLGCGCWLIFLWAVHSGEFNDIERPKHRMLYDDEETPDNLTGIKGINGIEPKADDNHCDRN